MPAPEVKKLVSKHVPAIADAVSCWRGSRVSTSNDCGECVPCWCALGDGQLLTFVQFFW